MSTNLFWNFAATTSDIYVLVVVHDPSKSRPIFSQKTFCINHDRHALTYISVQNRNVPLHEEITPYFEGFTCKGSHILHFSNISTTMHIRAVTWSMKYLVLIDTMVVPILRKLRPFLMDPAKIRWGKYALPRFYEPSNNSFQIHLTSNQCNGRH